MIDSDLNSGAVIFSAQSLHAAPSCSATFVFLSIIYFMLYVAGWASRDLPVFSEFILAGIAWQWGYTHRGNTDCLLNALWPALNT
jgi:hypothetical protein